MNSETQGQLAVLDDGFDYALIADEGIAEQVRSAADKIRQMIRKTLAEIIEIGRTLLTVKEALPHGQFLNWLSAEFGWRERSVQNVMAVATRFGESAKFADLPIQPSAAYVLAAPSVPDKAREVAVNRAEAGEQITVKVAEEIVARAKKGKKRPRHLPVEQLAPRLVKVLERYRERWSPKELAELVRQLRDFADTVEKPQMGESNGQKG
jgi:hypothetical protein